MNVQEEDVQCVGGHGADTDHHGEEFVVRRHPVATTLAVCLLLSSPARWARECVLHGREGHTEECVRMRVRESV